MFSTLPVQKFAVLSLVAASLLGSPAALCKQAYGEHFLRQGATALDLAPVSAAAPVVVAPGEENTYVARLEQGEQGAGPYADSLSEPLTDLGRYHALRGEPQEALRYFRRALHIVRVNDGLYSARQVPILRAELDTYRAGGQLQALDERYDYYFRLFGQGRPPYTELRLRAALAYLRWQREAIRLGIDERPQARLLETYMLNKKLLQDLDQQGAPAADWRRELVYSQLRNLYLVQDRVAPRLEKHGLATSAPVFGEQWTQQDMDEKRLLGIQRGAMSEGARLLREEIETAPPGAAPEEEAQLQLALGDWYQWHNRPASAAPAYAEAIALLRSGGREDLLQDWLAEPVELPDNGAFWQPPAVPDGAPETVTVRYDVSPDGRARNVEYAGQAPAAGSLGNRLKRGLRDVRFRPRWISGEPEEVSGLTRTYIVPR